MRKDDPLPVLTEAPKSYEEALALRAHLIETLDRLQDELAASPARERRDALVRTLRGTESELRRVKEWLRKNDSAKESEWKLLARAHRLLLALSSRAEESGLTEELESLLDAIERVIPGRYLDEKGSDAT